MMAALNGQTNTVGEWELYCLKAKSCSTFSLCPHFWFTEVLVSSGKADLSLQDTERNTALHLACSKVAKITPFLCYILKNLILFSSITFCW